MDQITTSQGVTRVYQQRGDLRHSIGANVHLDLIEAIHVNKDGSILRSST